MLKTVRLNIFVETVIHFIFKDSLINKVQKNVFLSIFCHFFNVSLQNKSINFFKKEGSFFNNTSL